ncbi:hypothetical protein JFL47_13855 [Haemophilus haemoglobinophilus]|nr:hypothetical protein [Canicola haemoglobinophilus]MBN6712280.1 hypothetical protein [Canicola haemoglobinophilus]
MSKLFLLLLCLCSSYAFSCFNENEYNAIIIKLKQFDSGEYQDYGFNEIANIVDCKEGTTLSFVVCNNIKLEKAMLLLSRGEIYAYENATHSPVPDYSTYNDNLKFFLNKLVEEQKNKEVALQKLCYVIKTRLSDNFGGEFYYKPNVHEVLSTKLNKHGIIVQNSSSVFYLGKSCDAINGAGSKGKWYINKDKFIIELENSTYRFNYDEKVFSLNCRISQ